MKSYNHCSYVHLRNYNTNEFHDSFINIPRGVPNIVPNFGGIGFLPLENSVCSLKPLIIGNQFYDNNNTYPYSIPSSVQLFDNTFSNVYNDTPFIPPK